MTDTHSPPQPEAPAFSRSRYAIGLLVMGAIATYGLHTQEYSRN